MAKILHLYGALKPEIRPREIKPTCSCKNTAEQSIEKSTRSSIYNTIIAALNPWHAPPTDKKKLNNITNCYNSIKIDIFATQIKETTFN